MVQKLRIGNLQSERGRYDGAMVYAQHKVRGDRRALLWRIAPSTHLRYLGNPSGTLTCVCVSVLQRQQVVMTEQLAKTHTSIHFSVMHPGWVDTPGILSNPIFFFPSLTFHLMLAFCRRVCLSQRSQTACQTSIAP